MIISLNSVFLTEGDIFTFALYSYKAFFWKWEEIFRRLGLKMTQNENNEKRE